MPTPLHLADQADLLAIARAAALHRLGLGPPPALPEAGPLAEPGGAAVELTVRGEVRASLAWLSPDRPLAATVARLAARAADGDPRFPLVRPDDAPSLGVRVAVLGPLRRVSEAAPLRPGVEGVAVGHGWHRGLLLPSRARAAGWDGPATLKHACLAAGLPARAHEEPGATIEAFEALELPA